MNKFYSGGVVTAIKRENKSWCLYTIKDEYKSPTKIGIENYYIHAPRDDSINVGDVVFAMGYFGDKLIYEAQLIFKLGVLLINNLLVKGAEEINACEEIIKELTISEEWNNEMQ